MSHPLIEDNIRLLKSAVELIENLSDEIYAKRQLQGKRSGIGPHMRHVLDHYEVFLSSTDQEVINYDLRTRNDQTESSVKSCLQSLYQLIAGFEGLKGAGIHLERNYRIKMDCGSNVEIDAHNSALSSLSRELQFLVSHTIHHFAIIDIYCQLLDIEVPKDFGVAPSTLKHRDHS